MSDEARYASHEQRVYARWLDIGTRIGFIVLLASFVVLVLELVPPGVALEDLARHWHLPVDEFVRTTNAPTGWLWLGRLDEGDVLNYIGVAILAVMTIICYARVLPLFLGAHDRLFVAICVAEILVLLTAASGILGGAH